MVEYLTDLQETIDLIKNSKVPIIMYFSAVWCKPCMKIAPYFEQLNEEITGCDFFKVDIDDAVEISDYFEVKSMPTFYFFYKGEAKDKFEGADSEKLLETIKKIFIEVAKDANETKDIKKEEEDNNLDTLAEEINEETKQVKEPFINRIDGIAESSNNYSFI
jgi:thioredoxin 1